METLNESKKRLIEAVTDFANSKATPLTEFAVLKAVIVACENRLDEIKKDATHQAQILLHDEVPVRESGEFEFSGQTFELSLTENYDFVKNAHRYNNAEGARIRQYAAERDEYKRLAEAKTKLIDAERKNFRAMYPHWEPDSITAVLKVKGLDKKKKA